MYLKVLDFKQTYSRKRDEMEDWVLLAPADDVLKTRTWKRIKSILPPKGGFDQEKDQMGTKMAALTYKWEQIKPHYDAWKEGTEVPENGTPLLVWNGLESDAVKALQRAGLKTVEDVMNAGDSMMQKVQWPNARKLPQQARAFLENRDAADATRRMEERDAEIAALKEQMAALQEQKPKRGRPPKEKAEEVSG